MDATDAGELRIVASPSAEGSASGVTRRTAVYMDTVVSIEIVATSAPPEECLEWSERAFGWFQEIEAKCSRFRPDSDIGRLAGCAGTPVVVSPLAFEVIRFALSVAEATDGAFDPTIGAALEAAGFDREYRSGRSIASGVQALRAVTFRDIQLDPADRSVLCRLPLVLDLGGVAKGLAVDLAAEELTGADGFAINAGGDAKVHGLNPDGQPWSVGVRDPREPEELIEILRVTDTAICTSGGYERPNRRGDGSHIIDPATGRSPDHLAGVTVLAPSAMLADALATAVFVLGPDRGVALLEEHDAKGLLVLPSGDLVRVGLGRPTIGPRS